MLQQQQQNSDNVGGGGGEDDEEGDQHEVNKRDVFMVENNTENEVYVENNDENIENNVEIIEDQQLPLHNFLRLSGLSENPEFEGLTRLSDNGLTSLSDEELTSLNEKRLTSFTDVLKSLNRSKRSSSSTAGSVCAPVRSANP